LPGTCRNGAAQPFDDASLTVPVEPYGLRCSQVMLGFSFWCIMLRYGAVRYVFDRVTDRPER
ncbi:MAG: hypothetical protein ACKODB_04855, partial [Betaproteobacteria bacterium]